MAGETRYPARIEGNLRNLKFDQRKNLPGRWGVDLERFRNSRALFDSAKGAFFLRKKALESIGFGHSNCGTAMGCAMGRNANLDSAVMV